MEGLNIPAMRKDGFSLRESHGIRYYTCSAFAKIPGLYHGFSTRPGGAPGNSGSELNLGFTSWDSAERVEKNRRRFLSRVGIGGSQLLTLRQAHSNRVHIVEQVPGEWNRPEGDALATRLPDLALAVQVADCLPVLIADRVNRAVAAVHSGWRGTLSRVLLHTILDMRRVFQSNPSDLLIAVGPGIRNCCMEVGAEVAELFEKEHSSTVTPGAGAGKYLLDLSKALEIQLNIAGVPAENCFDLGACTRCRTDEFFSYRAEGTTSGRLLAVIGLTA